MFRRNRWFGGKVKLVLPPLPPQYLGQSGAIFQTWTIDPKVGDEVVLCFLDDPEFSHQLGQLNPFKLRAKNGIARTSAGPIAFVLWSVFSRQGHVVDYEQTLNLFNIDTIHLLSSLGQQSHLKIIIVDSSSSETVGFFEHKNIFEFDRFAAGMAQVAGHEPAADFMMTQAAFQTEFTLEQLKRA